MLGIPQELGVLYTLGAGSLGLGGSWTFSALQVLRCVPESESR